MASLKSQSADLTKGESALRRSLALLAGIREEFPPENKEYRRLFTLAHKQPAAELIQLLISGSRHIEAEEITRQWAE